MSGLFGGFLNPLIVAGTALALLPILIHILNRRRHRPLEWGAMRFVLAAYRRTRRRAQLENLLLLLLRAGAIVLLALALARPFTGEASPLGALTEKRRDLVLVLDASASTGYRESVESVFERIRERAREILLELDGSRGDRVRLLLARGYAQRLTWRTPEEALSVLSTLEDPSHEALDLTAAMGEVAAYAEEDAAGTGTSALEIRLLTDLQRTSFEPAGAPLAEAAESALADELDRLDALGLTVLVEDLGSALPIPPNVGISDVVPLGVVLGAGTVTEIAVSVENFGQDAESGVRVALEVDGERQPVRTVELVARGRGQVVFPVVFSTPGHHVLGARLDGDRLAADDERCAVVWIPPPLRVLLVNGAPGERVETDEVGYVLAALEPLGPTDGLAPDWAPFHAREVRAADLGHSEVDLDEYDAIVLANVAALPPEAVEELEARVAAGAALLVSLGDHVDPLAYNGRLWRPDGSGLLPAALERRVAVTSRREAWFRVKDFDAEHPALAFFADERWQPLLTEVPIYEFYSTAPLPNARTLARLDDEEGHALLLERSYDRGRVFLWTSTLDADWTRVAESPRTLVPLLHELLRYAGRPSEPRRNVSLGEPLLAELATFPRGATRVAPDGSRRPLDGEPTSISNGRWRLPPVSDTDRPGLWKIELEGHAPLAFAVAADAREGDLARISEAELGAVHPALALLEGGEQDDEETESTGGVRGELWRWLALACLTALVLESLWAARVGTSRGGAA